MQWSLLTSAPRYTFISRRDLPHFLLIITPAIWLIVRSSEDFQVSLWTFLWRRDCTCFYTVLVPTKINQPFQIVLIQPQPCFSMAFSQLLLFKPNLALISPIIKSITCWGTLVAAWRSGPAVPGSSPVTTTTWICFSEAWVQTIHLISQLVCIRLAGNLNTVMFSSKYLFQLFAGPH